MNNLGNMKHKLLTAGCSSLFLILALAGLANAGPLVFEGTEGPGKGKHIVFLAGDHEYRSEESLPELADPGKALWFQVHGAFQYR